MTADTTGMTALNPDHLAIWKGVTYDTRCLDARFNGGHRETCPTCTTKGCCSHCFADGLTTLAELDARKATP